MLDTFHLLNISYVAHALYAATSWKVLDRLEETGGDFLPDLAAACKVNPSILETVLQVLQAFGYMKASPEGKWMLGNRAKRLMSTEHGWLKDYVMIWGRQLIPAFESLVELADGEKNAFEIKFGKKLWDHNRQSKIDNELFVRYMDIATLQHTITDEIPCALNLHKACSVIDVGGGSGRFLASVLKYYPNLQGSVFDQPHVKTTAENNLITAGCADRGNFIAGNFLIDDLPAGADAYFLKHVLHDWPDVGAASILLKIARAMQSNSRLYIIEGLLDDNFASKPWLRTRSIEQTVWTGGKVRTRRDFDSLLESSGLHIVRVQDTKAGLDTTVLEIAKL